MPTIQHKDLVGAELHEPKGIDSALGGAVYVANGSGSGSWQVVDHAYCSLTASGDPQNLQDTIVAPTTYKPIWETINAPNASTDLSPGFSASLRWKITYTASRIAVARISYSISAKHNNASSRDVFVTLSKNGVPLTNLEIFATLATNIFAPFGSTQFISLVQNDTIELVLKVAAGNIITHAPSLTVDTLVS